MNVLITGASTPLGIAMLDALLSAPDVEHILACGRDLESPRPIRPGLAYHRADLRRPRELHDLLWGPARELGIDHVIHNMHHRSASDEGRRIHAQNVDATRELVLGCLGHPTIKRLIYRSFAEVYAFRYGATELLDEQTPLDFDPDSPQWIRDRVEADLTVCSHFGASLEIAVLRFAEIMAPNIGSQLWDYLQSRVCLRPLGYDPMINVLSMADAVTATMAALRSTATGVFNIPGRDTLPLSRAIVESRRADLPVPNLLLAPLYRLRRRIAGFEFRYDMNFRKFHFGALVDGTRARERLGFVPQIPTRWPSPWWETLFARLAESR